MITAKSALRNGLFEVIKTLFQYINAHNPDGAEYEIWASYDEIWRLNYGQKLTGQSLSRSDLPDHGL